MEVLQEKTVVSLEVSSFNKLIEYFEKIFSNIEMFQQNRRGERKQ